MGGKEKHRFIVVHVHNDSMTVTRMSQQYSLQNASSWDDRQLELAMNRFLEFELLASAPSDDHDAVAAFRELEPLSSSSLREDPLFLGIGDSIDIPDLDFGESNAGVTTQDLVTAASGSQTPTSPATEPTSHTSSLVASPPQPEPARMMTTAPRSSSAPTSGDRKNLKHELEYLRQQVQGLESQLEEIQGGSDDDDTAPPHSCLWERVAHHQQGEKQKAMAENLRLRETLEDQLRLARSLDKVLRRRRDLSVRILLASTHCIECGIY